MYNRYYYQLMSLILWSVQKKSILDLCTGTDAAKWMIVSLRYLADTYARCERENRIAQVGYKRSNKITNVFRHREIYRGFIVP